MFNARDIKIALAGRKNRSRQNSNNEEPPKNNRKKYRHYLVKYYLVKGKIEQEIVLLNLWLSLH
jgi:hypothetical protein